jgi:hypothetical protein
VRVHLERLVELECLAIRHGRLGSQFVYELLLDPDAPEALAHVGLIDVKVLAHDYKTNLTGLGEGVAGQNGNPAGGGKTGPPPLESLAVNTLGRTWRGGGNAHQEPAAQNIVS